MNFKAHTIEGSESYRWYEKDEDKIQVSLVVFSY